MIVLSVDPDDVPGMTVFDPFFRIVPADGDNTPYTKGITEDLYGFGDSLADTDTMAQRPDDLVGIWLFQLVVADIFADEVMDIFFLIPLGKLHGRCAQACLRGLPGLSDAPGFYFCRRYIQGSVSDLASPCNNGI